MKLSEIFTQFKHITPDPQYAEHAKHAIIAQPQFAAPARRPLAIFFRVVEGTAGLALAGVLIFSATGWFTGKSVAPINTAVIDPTSLHAEAQAIDIQIQLANLAYTEPASSPLIVQSGTAASSAAATHAVAASPAAGSSSATSTSAAASSTPSSTLSVNQALRELSQ